MCLIPSFLSPAPFSHFPPHLIPEDFGMNVQLSLSSCLLPPFSSACLTSSFSLFSPGEILLCHRGDSPATAFIRMVCGGKKESFSVSHYHGPPFRRTSFAACSWLSCCLHSSTDPEDTLYLLGYSPQWSH